MGQSRREPAEFFPVIASLPAWRGLQAGSSTRTDLIAYLEQNNVTLQHEVIRSNYEQYRWDESISNIFDYQVDTVYAHISPPDPSITDIGVWLYGELDITSVIQLLGEPEYYDVEFNDDERPTISVTLYYESLGTILSKPRIPIRKLPNDDLSNCIYDLKMARFDEIYFVPRETFFEFAAVTRGISRDDEFREWTGLDVVPITDCE